MIHVNVHDKQSLLSLDMKIKVVQYVPRIIQMTHVTQVNLVKNVNHVNHVTLTGSQLLFDFQTFSLVVPSLY